MSAIYHFSAQVISRRKGRSSLAAAAYRAAEKMIDEVAGIVHDFTRKRGVAHTEILLPPTAPRHFSDRATLWAEVEKVEKRKDAQLAREIDIALPRCLSNADKIRLAKKFAADVFVADGMIADLCFHDLDSKNPHVHIMLTTRDVDENGFGKKNRTWNDRDLLVHWREQWANYTNSLLEHRGHSERIDHRTLLEQGITDREPQVHLGAARHAMLKRGEKVDSIEPQMQRQIAKRAERAAKDKALDAERIAKAKAHELAIQQELEQVHAELEISPLPSAELRKVITQTEAEKKALEQSIEHDSEVQAAKKEADAAEAERLKRSKAFDSALQTKVTADIAHENATAELETHKTRPLLVRAMTPVQGITLTRNAESTLKTSHKAERLYKRASSNLTKAEATSKEKQSLLTRARNAVMKRIKPQLDRLNSRLTTLSRWLDVSLRAEKKAQQQRTESERRADAFLDIAERIDNDKATDLPTDYNYNTPKM